MSQDHDLSEAAYVEGRGGRVETQVANHRSCKGGANGVDRIVEESKRLGIRVKDGIEKTIQVDDGYMRQNNLSVFVFYHCQVLKAIPGWSSDSSSCCTCVH